MDRINDSLITSLSEFKARPLDLIQQANKEPFVVLNHNKPAFYVLTPEIYEALLEALDDADLAIELMVEKRVKV